MGQKSLPQLGCNFTPAMKLEISIKANNLLKQDLLPGLARLVPEQQVQEILTKCSSGRFTLNFTVEAQSPDRLLQEIAAYVANIENHCAAELGIDLHVRNIDCSEPTLCTAQNKRPFSPVEGIRIVPWDGRKKPPPKSSDILLRPAHAFGTGLHPSTRLCLQLLKLVAERDLEKKHVARSVLDIGCGSGILTIAALRLGAARVHAVEIDPNAVEVARRNIQINRLSHSAQVLHTSWHDVTGQYDLILANLVPSVLFKAVPYIAKFLKEQALLITAGFPVSRNTKVLGLFEKRGLRLISEFSSDGWGALLITK